MTAVVVRQGNAIAVLGLPVAVIVFGPHQGEQMVAGVERLRLRGDVIGLPVGVVVRGLHGAEQVVAGVERLGEAGVAIYA